MSEPFKQAAADEMDDNDVLQILCRAFDEWAQDIWPNGAILECSRPSCYFSERITTEQAASYLAHGWPTHCGRTMRVEQPAPAHSCPPPPQTTAASTKEEK